MPELVTLTGNLLAERTLDLPADWRLGATHRAVRESFQVGGKGFNVAKMLQRLGGPVTAAGFVGGAAGAECEQWLRDQARYDVKLFSTPVPTRTGTVIRAPGALETTFLAPDRTADASALAACGDWLRALPSTTSVALCGSFPGWGDPETTPVRSALHHLASAGRLLLDTYGPPLADLVQHPARLIKINRSEFDALWPEQDCSTPVPGRLQEALQRWPAQAWVITDGPAPVWCGSHEGIGSIAPPHVTEISATGSGDVLFAAVLATWFLQRASLADAVRFALPLAALNAASLGVAEFPLPPSLRSFAKPGEIS
jgi:1-phosphofructokinase